MTKEELEKEAEHKWDTEIYSKCDDSDPQSFGSGLIEGYVAGAEPREKRISELEDKLANADYLLEGANNKIKELEEGYKEIKKRLLNTHWLCETRIDDALDFIDEQLGEKKINGSRINWVGIASCDVCNSFGCSSGSCNIYSMV